MAKNYLNPSTNFQLKLSLSYSSNYSLEGIIKVKSYRIDTLYKDVTKFTLNLNNAQKSEIFQVRKLVHIWGSTEAERSSLENDSI